MTKRGDSSRVEQEARLKMTMKSFLVIPKLAGYDGLMKNLFFARREERFSEFVLPLSRSP